MSFVWAHQTSLTPPLFLTCMYQAKYVNGYVVVCYGYRFYLFLQFFYWILETVFYLIISRN